MATLVSNYIRYFFSPLSFVVVSSGGTPANAYVAEDGTTFYVAEDGATFYVQES